MKLNSTVALTLVLLALMVGAGVVSAAWGIALGREALKGVTQPDSRPASNLAKRQGTAARREEFAILREEDIVASAKSRIMGTAKDGKSAAPNQSKAMPVANKKFPLIAESEGVALEIGSIRRQGDALILQVNLRNNSEQLVQFLYTDLSVVDERGRELSATAEGLPSDLPSTSETFSGTISISTKGLDGATKLSLSLPDYPGQQINLDVSDIPVPR